MTFLFISLQMSNKLHQAFNFSENFKPCIFNCERLGTIQRKNTKKYLQRKKAKKYLQRNKRLDEKLTSSEKYKDCWNLIWNIRRNMACQKYMAKLFFCFFPLKMFPCFFPLNCTQSFTGLKFRRYQFFNNPLISPKSWKFNLICQALYFSEDLNFNFFEYLNSILIVLLFP